MSIIESMCKQKAVWWKKIGADKFGKNTYDAAIEVKCRWENGEGETLNQQGITVPVSCAVYVRRVMTPGDVLMLITLAELNNTQINTQEPERLVVGTAIGLAINNFTSKPNLRNTKKVHTASL